MFAWESPSSCKFGMMFYLLVHNIGSVVAQP